ncbi:pentatricopeptide repeat-containing protein At1g61870, mitochondrial [Solanum stenotomum]|uniref:pentatricopeptide repeat-containing protein At1g61870, mitochondrial n=1 Tax=Solanum stenotomum TaxID=172797 RepID=UPI0020D05F52|nr:pentatricopeptide repeat-containing protein At1g61870, mitochondrial [Solanum stenotomum]
MAALRSKFRFITSQHHHHLRHYSAASILNPDSKSPLSGKDKSRAALTLLKSETNPQRILDICRAAALTPESHLDRIAYSKAISKLKDLNHFSGIRSFLQESTTRPDLKSERFISHFIVLYGQAGLLDEAKRTFEEMEKMGIQRTERTLNALLFACVLAQNYAEMKRVFVEFPKKYGFVPNLDTYNVVIKGFCESGSASSVYSILDEMKRNNVKPNAESFGTCISGFYKEEKYEDVGKMLEMMKGYKMVTGISTYNVRIQSLCKLKKSGEAKALLDGILSRGLKANCASYGHLILGFCKEGNLEEAKSMFQKMVNSGLTPDAECYFTLVYYLCQSRDFEAALEMYKKCLADGWVPNFSTMKSLVEGLASISKVDEAREVIAQVKEKISRNLEKWNDIEEALPK